VRIGVLALQGGFAAHAAALAAAGDHPVMVRDGAALAGLDGLVLPGGESTTMLALIARFGLRPPLDHFVATGKPVLATCAGLILAARQVSHPAQPSFAWLDVAVARNGWGRQRASFQATADDERALPLVFIRAPRIIAVGAQAEVLVRVSGEPVMVRERNVTGATFHPELTGDGRVHRAVFHAA
jgi:5'-phosphate synthase pdxT subunit